MYPYEFCSMTSKTMSWLKYYMPLHFNLAEKETYFDGLPVTVDNTARDGIIYLWKNNIVATVYNVRKDMGLDK